MGISNVTISVIDDDESVRRALKRLLKSAGYSVEVFSSAHDFLDRRFSNDSSGLLILDIQMPEMDGFELMDVLSSSRGKWPVIFITAHDNPGTKARAIDGGAVAFLQKPFDDTLLLDAIARGAEQVA